MIGVVRERQHHESFAGVRTHVLTALAGVLAAMFGTPVLALLLLFVVVLTGLAYWRSAALDAGVTGEIALMLTALLGALAITQPAMASGLGALTAALLYAKKPLHRFSRELLSEDEVHDGLILLASALVILPLLPDKAIDSFGVLNLAKLWRLAVLVMLVGAVAHIALRIVGNRFGLPLAGFFSGYVSSTAATLTFAQTAKQNPALVSPALSAALLANAASLSLFIPILMAMSPMFLTAILPEVSVAIGVLVVLSLFGLRKKTAQEPEPAMVQKRMFHLGHALGLVALIAAILIGTAALSQWLGAQWAIAVAMLAAAAELHGALAGMAQLVQNDVLSLANSHWGLLGLLLSTTIAKSIIAWFAGGKDFAWRFMAAMAVMLLSVTLTALCCV
jgi:uncharacterized membrane protein (DUF4010 family)